MNLYKYAVIMCVFDDPPDGKITISKVDETNFIKSIGSYSRFKDIKIDSLDRIANMTFNPSDEIIYFEIVFNGTAVDTGLDEKQKIVLEFLCTFDIEDFNKSKIKANIVIVRTGEIIQRLIPQKRWI